MLMPSDDKSMESARLASTQPLTRGFAPLRSAAPFVFDCMVSSNVDRPRKWSTDR